MFRLPADVPCRPTGTTATAAEVVLVVPAHNEAGRIGPLLAGMPLTAHGMTVRCTVVDDGSTDETVGEALAAGAKVVSHPSQQGLGAAIRTGLAAAVADGCAVVAFCDGDGEYSPFELEAMTAPIVSGDADYVVGSRFAGVIRHMRPHRRFGNIVLTRWVRWMARRPITDGQSGYRALSCDAASAADIIHDYNYAQVLTLNLVGQGFVYAEVPISYESRRSGTSFVRLAPYLRRVVPAALREIRRQSSTT